MTITHRPGAGAEDLPEVVRRYPTLLRTRLGSAGRPDDAGVAGVLVAVARSLFDLVDPSGSAGEGAPLANGEAGEPHPLGDLDPQIHLGVGVAPLAADLIGRVHEALIAPGGRRSRGAFYTPRDVAEGVVESATTRWRTPVTPSTRVCDPACGGGAFLLAAGRFLESRQERLGPTTRSELVARSLYGVDVDPLAAAVADAALRLWVAEAGGVPGATNVSCADGLEVDHPEPFDLVVGNPPFQGQLSRRTARSRDALEHLRERLGPIVHGYVDTAALFLASGLSMVGEGGRVALVQPSSFLVARDAARARHELAVGGELVALWWPGEALFDASVRVCVPVLERRQAAGEPTRSPVVVARWVGPDRRGAPAVTVEPEDLRAARTWGQLVADLRGVPVVDLEGRGRLGEVAGATAGFRRQFYDLAPFVVDDPRSTAPTEASERTQRGTAQLDEALWPRLVTSGLIDPALCLWGRREARFAGRRLAEPRVDMSRLVDEAPALANWARARLVPKVLLATQTQVLEAAVDEAGTWWPSVPVVSVEPRDPGVLWHLCAVLLAPPVTAWAMARYAGSARSEGSVKLAASQVLAIPLPEHGEAWERAVAHVRAGAAAAQEGDGESWALALDAAGQAMCEAYGTTDEVWHWWRSRRPPFRVA